MNVIHTKMIAKVKAVAVTFGFFVASAGATAALEFSDTVDWQGFGIFGPAIGAAVATGLAWVVAYVKRSAPDDVQAIQIQGQVIE